MHGEEKYMLFIFMCAHEDMKKIPARPLLIDYGLAGMGLMLSWVDSGVSWSGLTLLLIDYGLAGVRLMASTSSFLALRPPFLVLTGGKGGKRKSSPQPGAGKLSGGTKGCQLSPQPGAGKFAGYMIEMIVYPAFIFHLSFVTSPLAR